MKVPFCDFIQNLSRAPSKWLSKWIKVDEWDYFKNTLQELNFFFYGGGGAYESLERLKGKIGEASFFKVQSGKITLCSPNDS